MAAQAGNGLTARIGIIDPATPAARPGSGLGAKEVDDDRVTCPCDLRNECPAICGTNVENAMSCRVGRYCYRGPSKRTSCRREKRRRSAFRREGSVDLPRYVSLIAPRKCAGLRLLHADFNQC